MVELLRSGKNTSELQEDSSELTLFSKPLFVSETMAARYDKASKRVGASFWYLSPEGDEIDREKWQGTLQHGFMGYVQLGYHDKAMWQSFCEEEEKLAEQEEKRSRDAYYRQHGVLRSTENGFKIPERSGVVVRFGGKYTVREVRRKAA